MTNKKPAEISITKVKQFEGSSAFVRRSQWSLDQLRQVNGIDPNRVSHNHLKCGWHRASSFLFLSSYSCHTFFLSLFFSLPVTSQDCPEFDLTFENAFDQWVAGSAGDKCVFVQVLHNTCQRYSAERKPEFVNCQSKLLGGEHEQRAVTMPYIPRDL